MRRRIPTNSLAARLSLAALLLLVTAQAADADPLTFQDVAGSAAARQSPQGGGATGQAQTVDLGEVTGTVCDCGEIEPAPGGVAPGGAVNEGGFPKFPLLALAAGAPAICFTGICSNNPPEPPPTPTPETPVPEPLTAATLAAGLAALARLRTRRRRDP